MKILVANTGFNSVGGIETYIKNICESFEGNGHTVYALATNFIGNIHGAFGKNIQFNDLASVPLGIRKVYYAARLVNRMSPDILLLNHCSLLHYALPFLRKSIQPVVVLHSDDPRFYATASLFSPWVGQWVAPTPGVAEAFRQYIPARRWHDIQIIPHGVNTEIFGADFRKLTTDPVITFVGYVAENKGADLLPRIFQKVAEESPGSRLNIVGYGPLIDALKKEFRDFGLEERCTFTGPLSPGAVASVLAQSDIFLLPTRIEGFGLAIVEAMMGGAVPVVTSLSGITDSIVDNSLTGFLIQKDDVEGFANVINSLLSDRQRLSRISDTSRKKSLEKFSLDGMAGRYEQIFIRNDCRMASFSRFGIRWFFILIKETLYRALNFKL